MKMYFTDDVIASRHAWFLATKQSLYKGIVLLVVLLSSCTPTSQPAQVIVNAYATSAATPWLTDLYACAANSNTVVNISAEAPDILLRVGEPESLAFPAYQIGVEEILIVTGSESPLAELSMEEAQTLFAQGSPSVQVWVYPSGMDIQSTFNQLVMKGRSVTSGARVAVDPQKMSESLQSTSFAIGILSRGLLVDNLREIASAGNVPVFALVKEEPQGAILELVSCLQHN
jgi:hypothetical protein